jgi:hypothetical protein
MVAKSGFQSYDRQAAQPLEEDATGIRNNVKGKAARSKTFGGILSARDLIFGVFARELHTFAYAGG